MSIADIIRLFKEIFKERQSFDLTVIDIYYQDLTGSNIVISPHPMFVVEVKMINGHVPRLGVSSANLKIGEATYETDSSVKPLEQGEVRKQKFFFPTNEVVCVEGAFVFELVDSRGRKIRRSGTLEVNLTNK